MTFIILSGEVRLYRNKQRSKDSLNDKGISIRDVSKIKFLLEIENNCMISKRSLIDELDIISHDSLKDSLIETNEKNLKDLESGIHWREEESRMVSQLMLKNTRDQS